MVHIRKSGALLLQVTICLGTSVVLGLAPPAQGRMLLLPLSAGSAAVGTALRNGAGLVGRGPIRGSILIDGDLSRLTMPLARAGAVLLAAPAGCGPRAA